MAVSNNKLVDAYRKKNKAIDKSVQAGDKAYEAQIDDIREDAADRLQGIYLQNERQKRLREQAQKAAGITGGASESAAVALAANYNSNRTDMMLERDRQISEIGIQREQAKAEGELQKSANDIEMEQSRLSFETGERDFAWQKQNADRSFKASQDEQTRSEAWEMVKAGVVNAELARLLGKPISVLREFAKRYKEN